MFRMSDRLAETDEIESDTIKLNINQIELENPYIRIQGEASELDT